MRLAVLSGGGKDSLYAAYLMHSMGHELRYLLTMYPAKAESYMFHYPDVHMTELQAEAMGIKRLVGTTPGEKEEELVELRELMAMVGGEVDGIVTGALASNYQRSRIEAICKDLGLASHAPLWQIDPEKLWEGLLGEGFEVIITSVSAQGLGEGWLGRRIDRQALQELTALARRHRFHLGFEGGEAETLVLDMPLFRKRIRVLKARREWDGTRGQYTIEEAELVEKG